MDKAYKDLLQSQLYYIYFILPISGSAFVYSVGKIEMATLSWKHCPLGIAAFLWGISFMLGCYYILCQIRSKRKYFDYLVMSNYYSEDDPDAISALNQKNRYLERAQKMFKIIMWLLALGVISYSVYIVLLKCF